MFGAAHPPCTAEGVVRRLVVAADEDREHRRRLLAAVVAPERVHRAVLGRARHRAQVRLGCAPTWKRRRDQQGHVGLHAVRRLEPRHRIVQAVELAVAAAVDDDVEAARRRRRRRLDGFRHRPQSPASDAASAPRTASSLRRSADADAARRGAPSCSLLLRDAEVASPLPAMWRLTPSTLVIVAVVVAQFTVAPAAARPRPRRSPPRRSARSR